MIWTRLKSFQQQDTQYSKYSKQCQEIQCMCLIRYKNSKTDNNSKWKAFASKSISTNQELPKQEQGALNLFSCAMSRIIINDYCGEIDSRRVLIMPFFFGNDFKCQCHQEWNWTA